MHPRTVRGWLTGTRALVQALSVLGLLWALWVAGLGAVSWLNPSVYFQMDALAMLLTALAERMLFTGVALALVVLVLTAIFGRFFCGWVCPLGALLDATDRVLSFVGINRILKHHRREGEPSRLPHGKYVLLAVLIIAALAGVQLVWPVDPIAIVVRSFSFVIYPAVLSVFDTAFNSVLAATNYPTWLDAGYNMIRFNVFSSTMPVFAHAAVVTALFVAILGLVLVRRRWWCRYVCPLGALLASVARYAPFQRSIHGCTGCGQCRNECRMNAIYSNNTYVKHECILCMDCVTGRCVVGGARFGFGSSAELQSAQGGVSRKQFLMVLGGALAVLGGFGRRAHAAGDTAQPVVRPPGAVREDLFVDRCIRCGNCMKVCPTNVLQPCVLESGWQGIWTPHANFEIGYCEHQCTLCGQVCPTGAIQKLQTREKMNYKMGLSTVHRDRCIPYCTTDDCIVCEEQCPVADKAIKLIMVTVQGKTHQAPVVDPVLCVGCGICQYRCPAQPRKAITVAPL